MAPSASGAWLDALYAVIGVAAGAVVAVLVVATISGIFRHRRRGPEEREWERQTPPGYAFLFIGGFALAVLWLLIHAPRPNPGQASRIVSGGVAAPAAAVAGPPPTSPTVLVAAVVAGIVLVALAAL